MYVATVPALHLNNIASHTVDFLPLAAYGKVFLVRKIRGSNSGQLFAMKILKKAYVTRKKKTAEHTLTERDVLESVRDFPFLATLHYAFQTDTKLHLIMGEWEGGEGRGV